LTSAYRISTFFFDLTSEFYENVLKVPVIFMSSYKHILRRVVHDGVLAMLLQEISDGHEKNINEELDFIK
jgi:hypothetical protein